ncbi:MIP/aquaporin family protein [Streptomyces sp. NPDC051217]|uniref:MIP/aquaporin family protein n=1 Tax=Streptomyces sp. NPDC051217 TaxID=3365644 RepID=UPI0037A8F46C
MIMVSTAFFSRLAPLTRAADEFILTTVVLFLAVTILRWLRDASSALYIADLNVALGVVGALSGAILTGLILTPLGRRSGGHMNPAVTVFLSLMKVFPGRSVVPYVLAQLLGSVAGTALARLVWGSPVGLPAVNHAAIRPALTWEPISVFFAEAGAMAGLMLVVGLAMTRTRLARLVPYLIGLGVALVITLLGPLSGGSINPARQFGPALFSGPATDLGIYLVAPVLGAAFGAWLSHLLRPRTRPLSAPTRTVEAAALNQATFQAATKVPPISTSHEPIRVSSSEPANNGHISPPANQRLSHEWLPGSHSRGGERGAGTRGRARSYYSGYSGSASCCCRPG